MTAACICGACGQSLEIDVSGCASFKVNSPMGIHSASFFLHRQHLPISLPGGIDSLHGARC